MHSKHIKHCLMVSFLETGNILTQTEAPPSGGFVEVKNMKFNFFVWGGGIQEGQEYGHQI